MIPDLLQRIRASDDTGPAFASVQKRMTTLEQRFAAAGAQMTNLGTVTRQGFNTIALGATGAVAGFLTLGAVVGGTRAALERFGDIADKSAAAGIDPEFFQGIAQQAGLAGVGIDTVAGALTTFSKNVGLAAEGRGKMFTTLSAINPELLKMIQLAGSQEDRFLLVADALAQARDQTQQAALATAIWGDAGAQLVPVFARGADAISLQIAKARELGLIVDRGLIEQADELGDRWDVASQVLDLKVKGALVALAPLMTDLVSAAADFATYMGRAWEASKQVGERSQAALENQFSSLQAIKDKAEGGGFFSGLQWTNGGASERYNTVLGELRNRALDDLRSQLLALPGAGAAGATMPGSSLAGGASPSASPSLSTGPVVSGLGNVDQALEVSKSNIADWALRFNSEIDRTGHSMDTLAQQAEAAWSGTADLVAGAFDAMATMVGSSSKESFEMSKKLQMASAIVTGISSTMAAYKAGWETGPITGPTLSVLWAGIAGVTAAARVAAIGATSFESKSMGGGGASSATGSAAAASGSASQGVSITLQGEYFRGEQVAKLINDIQSHLGTQGKTLNISHVNGG